MARDALAALALLVAVASAALCPAGEGYKTKLHTTGLQCTSPRGDNKIAVSGFTDTTDKEINGAYEPLPDAILSCKNTAPMDQNNVACNHGAIETCSVSDEVPAANPPNKKCLGDAGQENDGRGIGQMYFQVEPPNGYMIYLAYVTSSPKYDQGTGALMEAGTGPVWLACKHTLATFVAAQSWSQNGAASGLSTSVADTLSKCKAMALAQYGDTAVPVSGSNGWAKFGEDTSPYTDLWTYQETKTGPNGQTETQGELKADMSKRTLQDLLKLTILQQWAPQYDSQVAIACPLDVCVACKAGSYAAAADMFCSSCALGKSGNKLEMSGSWTTEGDACSMCDSKSFTQAVGQKSCTACPGHSTAVKDRTSCNCDPGHKRICLKTATRAVVTGTLKAAGTYIKDEFVEGKPSFAITTAQAGELDQYTFFISYNASFREWQFFERQEERGPGETTYTYDYFSSFYIRDDPKASNFPPSGAWVSQASASALPITTENVIINCDEFTCEACPADEFNQLPSASKCTKCPDTMWTNSAESSATRSQCSCEPGHTADQAKCDDIEVTGHTSVFFNDIYKLQTDVINNKKHWKGRDYDIFYDSSMTISSSDVDCPGRWYFGNLEMSAAFDSNQDLTSNQKEYMKHTMYSECTSAAYPPSGPGWVDHKTNTGLNLLSIDCPASVSCTLCAAAKFANPTQTSCEQCPRGASCTEGRVYIEDAFYVSHLLHGNNTLNNNFQFSTNTTLYACIHEGACIGGAPLFANNFTCREGHTGRLCGICEKGWYMIGGACAACSGGKARTPAKAVAGVVSTLIGVGVAAIAILVIASFGYAGRLERTIDEITGKAETDGKGDGGDEGMENEEDEVEFDINAESEGRNESPGPGGAPAPPVQSSPSSVAVGSAWTPRKKCCSGLGEKIKIFSAYAQVTNLFYTSLTIPWPAEISAIFGVFGAINIDIFGTLSVGCVATSFYDTFVFVMIMPIAVILIAAFAYCLGMCCVKKPVVKTIWKGTIFRCLALALFLIYPTISKTVFQMWAGYAGETPIDGEVFLAIDLRINKADAEYQTYSGIAVVCFIFYVIGIPATFLFLLYHNGAYLEEAKLEAMKAEEEREAAADKKEEKARAEENEEGTKTGGGAEKISAAVISLAWMGQAYESQFWYWELVEFGRKLLLSAVVVFVRPGTAAQILVATLICVCFLGLVSYLRPYEEDKDDTFSFVSFMCLVFTLVLGLALRVGKAEVQSPTEVALFAATMVVVQCILFLQLAHALYESVSGSMKVKPRPVKEAEVEVDDLHELDRENGDV